MQVVKSAETRKELVQAMKVWRPREPIAVWDFRDNGITVYAVDAADLGTTVQIIEREVVEKAHDVQDSALPCIETAGWRDLVSQLHSQHPGVVNVRYMADKQVLHRGFLTACCCVLHSLLSYR